MELLLEQYMELNQGLDLVLILWLELGFDMGLDLKL
jgi:hypothetical protein